MATQLLECLGYGHPLIAAIGGFVAGVFVGIAIAMGYICRSR